MANDITTEAKPKLNLVGWSIRPSNFDEFWRYCVFLSKTTLCPDEIRNKPEDVMAIIQLGETIGLNPVQSIQQIMVLKGKATVWGEAFRGLILTHPELDRATFKEEMIYHPQSGEPLEARCTIGRKGWGQTRTASFSMRDAERAKLLSKDNWVKYPQRMLQARALSFAVKDMLPDFMNCIQMREDIEEADDASYQIVQEDVTHIDLISKEVVTGAGKLKRQLLNELGESDDSGQ